MKLHAVLAAGLVLVAVAQESAHAGDWPQLQGGPAHTGFTSDEAPAPFHLRWRRAIGQPTHPAHQPIVAGDRIYLGTMHGNFLALDRDDGQTVWTYSVGGAIYGSAAHDGQRLFICALDGACHAVRAADGKRIWRFQTGEGIWAAPVVAEGRVFVGGRDGWVYALRAKDGALIWKSPVGGPVAAAPAWLGVEGAGSSVDLAAALDAGDDAAVSTSARLFVAAADMHVYCFDTATGQRIWQSPKLSGAAIRDYWVVASPYGVVVATQPKRSSLDLQSDIQRQVMNPFNAAHRKAPVLVEDEALKKLTVWLADHPDHRTLFVLDPMSGREKLIAPIVGAAAPGASSPLPAISPDGWAYTVYANVQLGASGMAFVGRLDLKTGRMMPLLSDRYAPPQVGDEKSRRARAGLDMPSKAAARSDFWGGMAVSDQCWGVSVGGGRVYAVRDPGYRADPPSYNTLDIQTRLDTYFTADRSWRSERVAAPGSGLSAGSTPGSVGTAGSACSPPVIAGDAVFHLSVRGVLYAFQSGEQEP